MASILGSITQDGSGIGMLATAPLHRYGVCRPIGGMQAIPDALARCLTAAGGTIQLEAPVENILVQRGVANGVSLRGGKEIRADWVVAAIPPQVTGALLSSDIPGIEVLRSAPANAAGIGCFKVDFALRGQVAPARHAQERDDGVDLRRPTMFIGTLAQIITAEHEARTGRFPTCPPLTATILSAVDPTQAPSDQDILYVYAPAPVVPNDGWDAVRPGAEKRLVEATSAVLGDITGLEIGRAVETPQDLQDRLGAVNGCIYHVDQAVTRLGPLRPGLGWAGHRTRVPGLVLCGAGTHPGGGVSGIPGQLAARALLRRGR
jgi:phytoene dehydrogenase-like protein